MNRITIYICACVLALSAMSGHVSAQNVPETHRNSVERGKSLYDNDMFSAARYEAERIMRECDYISDNGRAVLASYRIKSDIRLGTANIDGLMLEYEASYRYEPEFMAVNLLYAGHYFQAKDYVKALSIIDKTDYELLSRKDKNTFLYYRSFCQLRTGDTKGAGEGFGKLANGSKNVYTTAATYYLGYISYLYKDFTAACSYFEKVRDDDHFGTYCHYYILECKLMLEDYAYVISHAEDVIARVDESSKPNVARMVSQAYYRTGSNKEAKEWFDSYSGSVDQMTRKDNYFLGIVSYSLESYPSAIESFRKVVDVQDSLSQSAYFHIANSYLNLRNKHEAMSNYSKAAAMSFDDRIREEALFNFAKLSFDVNSDISVFEQYLYNYPSSKRTNEIYSYMATSYLLSKKYASAIEVLNKVSDLTPQMTMNLQKAAFLRGMELFEMEAYKGAVTEFRTSVYHGRYNSSLAMLAKFWLAESHYRLKNYEEALQLQTELYNSPSFKSTSEFPSLLFSLGYTEFRLENYPVAIGWFDRFLETYGPEMSMVMEAKLRVGDSFFMLKDYAKAASVYEEVSLNTFHNSSILYAAYQSAVCYGLISMPEKKIQILENIYSRRDDSPIYPRAVYELGRTYVTQQRTSDAQRCFQYLLDDVADPMYNGKALLELGVLYSHRGDYDLALKTLTEVVAQMPMSKEAQDALAVIESIYITLNQPEEYLAYLERAGLSASRTADEKELIMFNAAEQVFLNGDYAQARESLEKYIAMYPEGQKLPQAYFYLGESCTQLGNKDAAADAYAQVMQRGDGSFLELATLYYARICYSMEQYDKSASAYAELGEIALIEHNKYEAKRGMMYSYYYGNKPQLAIDAASELMAAQEAQAEDAVMAEYITAKCCIVLARRDEALPLLQKLADDKFTPQGAEAAYLLIQDRYAAGMFEEVENMVYAFADAKSPQTYWLARSFIVLGDSFVDRGDLEQAEATFASLLEEYVPQGAKDDIHDQVKMRISKISQTGESYE